MDTFKSAFRIASINFHRWKRDYRIWFVFIFTALLADYYLKGLTNWADSYDMTVTICMLPSMYTPANIPLNAPKMILHIGMLILLCDAPFFHPITAYATMRSKRTSWWLGECIYIFVTAFIYMLFITFASSIRVLPWAEFGNEWGTAINALVYGTEELPLEYIWENIPTENLILYQTSAVKRFYPYATQLYTFLTGWATFSVLGLLVYCVSLIKKNISWGMTIAGIFIFLEPICNWFASGKPWIEAITPVCWNSICMLNLASRNNFLSISFVTVMYTILIVIFLIISWSVSKKITIELR